MILFDANIPRKLQVALFSFEPKTAQEMGWGRLVNGDLLDAAEKAGSEILLTGDKTIEYEQNMTRRKIAVVALSAPHWPIVKDHIPRIALAL